MTALRTFFMDWTGHPRALAALLVALASAISLPSFATTLLVPENYSFEAALSTAASGDSISVAANTLDGGIAELSQSITLISREIGANRLSGMLMDGLDPVRVEGFLFSFPEFGPYGSDEGRVIIRSSNAAFVNCSFEDMWSTTGPPISYAGTSNLDFDRCSFSGNFWNTVADSSPIGFSCIAYDPAGSTFDGSIDIRVCVFENQSAPIVAIIPVTVQNTQFLDCGPQLIYSEQSLLMFSCLVAGFIYTTAQDYLQPECFGPTNCIVAYGVVEIFSNTFVDSVFQTYPSGPCAGHEFTPDDFPAMIWMFDTGYVYNNIFVGLPGPALDAPAGVYVRCNDAWDIDGPAWRGGIGDVSHTNDNIADDPIFCNRQERDYTISSASLAAAANNSCGRMGAFDVACDIVPVAAPAVASRTALLGAFPNPFNPRTEIRFVLERAQSPAISIYDAAGRLVRRFPEKQYPAGAGTVIWNGQDDAGRAVASGVYFVQMITDRKQLTQRLALIR